MDTNVIGDGTGQQVVCAGEAVPRGPQLGANLRGADLHVKAGEQVEGSADACGIAQVAGKQLDSGAARDRLRLGFHDDFVGQQRCEFVQ